MVILERTPDRLRVGYFDRPAQRLGKALFWSALLFASLILIPWDGLLGILVHPLLALVLGGCAAAAALRLGRGVEELLFDRPSSELTVVERARRGGAEKRRHQPLSDITEVHVEESEEEQGEWMTFYYVRYRLRSGEEIELGKYQRRGGAESLANEIAGFLGMEVTRYHVRCDERHPKRVKL